MKFKNLFSFFSCIIVSALVIPFMDLSVSEGYDSGNRKDHYFICLYCCDPMGICYFSPVIKTKNVYASLSLVEQFEKHLNLTYKVDFNACFGKPITETYNSYYSAVRAVTDRKSRILEDIIGSTFTLVDCSTFVYYEVSD